MRTFLYMGFVENDLTSKNFNQSPRRFDNDEKVAAVSTSKKTVSAFLRICPSGTKGAGLFTLRSFNKGCIICTAIGKIQNFPTFTSIQIDEHQHFEPIGILEDGTNNAVAKLNHSCDPNSYVEYDRLNEFLLVKALKAISVDDELTIDYRKTEAKMVRPFNCNCGALNCGKYISGNENIKW